MFPDFIDKALASAATLGLDSYIIPITPNGTLICEIFNPLGQSHFFISDPMGSDKIDISLILFVISFYCLNN